jgi:hypothetical protein
MASPQIDTNINNYTYPELLIILDLDDATDTGMIIKKTNTYIEKYTRERNDKMIIFFKEIYGRVVVGYNGGLRNQSFLGKK